MPLANPGGSGRSCLSIMRGTIDRLAVVRQVLKAAGGICISSGLTPKTASGFRAELVWDL
ncbi:hypothetical protein HNQ71_003953 [Mesorhizobium sangaii]|uniref:Uncharacterized protein n=1 Tax=Mesorhizobium sangaii TaxID=505389 RepID=A0A841PMF6_9HYPH|nr:hypothetical protein [Mesorhizobium sangaii]